MMNKRIWVCLCFSALFVLTGCWDRAELPEKGFVMGVAIDKTDEGKISLTTQIFRPSQGVSAIGAKAAETAYVNVKTENDTVSRAIRDIPINLGRKTQWSHIRLIIIGEKLAREQKIVDVLEVFYRDHEPRLTVSVMIAEGKADQYLKIDPLIENTTSQQLFQSGKSTGTNSGKTFFTNLLKMGLQLKSEVGNAIVPYIFFSNDPPTVTNVAGVALLSKGKLVGRMQPKMVESLQMITGEYGSGMLDIPCAGKSNKKIEAVEVVAFQSKFKPTVIAENSLKVQVKVKMDISIMEMTCTKIKTIEDEQKFAKNVEAVVKERLEETAEWLKHKKFDAIGLGNKVYTKNPSLWKKLKPDWNNRFARTEFNIDVKVKVLNSGTVIPKPAFSK